VARVLRTLTTIMTVLGLLLVAEDGSAQPADEFEVLARQFHEHYGSGRFGAAIPFAEQALALAERRLGADDPKLAEILIPLGTAYRQTSRFAEAAKQFERALSLLEKALGSGHPQTVGALAGLADAYHMLGRREAAEPLAKRSIEIIEKAAGPEHPALVASLNTLASMLEAAGRTGEAEPIYKRAVVILEKHALETPDYASLLSNLAENYQKQGRYAEAEPLFKRALAITEKLQGPEHPNSAVMLSNLARLYTTVNRFAEADQALKRSLSIYETRLGPNHPRTANTLMTIGQLYIAQGRYAEAEPFDRKALAIRERMLGPDHADVGLSLNGLATLFHYQGRFAEAEAFYKRAIAIFEKELGPNDTTLGFAFNNLAEVYRAQGRFAEAEPLYKRSLAIREQTLGLEHPSVVPALYNLAGLFSEQGRVEEAEPLLKQGIAIAEKGLGADHHHVGIGFSNLAILYRRQSRYADAELHFRRALEIYAKAFGGEDRETATTTNNLGMMYMDQGRFAEADPLLERALALREKVLGPAHSQVAESYGNLGLTYLKQQKLEKAEPLLQRQIALRETALGPDHPSLAAAYFNLSMVHVARRQWDEALRLMQLSTAIARRWQGRPLIVRDNQANEVELAFANVVKVVFQIVAASPERLSGLMETTFEAAQQARQSQAAASLSQMAAREAKGDGEFARVVRERQNLVSEWQLIDRSIVAAAAKPAQSRDAAGEKALRERISAIDARMGEIERSLAAKFPEFAELANPKPLTIAAVQKLLKDDEALVVILDTRPLEPLPEEIFTWIVTKTGARLVRASGGSTVISGYVLALRCGLDHEAWNGPRCAQLLGTSYTPDDQAQNKPLPFDTLRAHQLYRALFDPASEKLISGKRLLIALSGALTQLPFHVLVTEAPKTAIPGSYAAYRDVPWLARGHPISALPAVSSLRALRELAKASRAGNAYVGFGNPLLEGDAAQPGAAAAAQRTREARCTTTSSPQPVRIAGRGTSQVAFRRNGDLADVAHLRTLWPLPETADELCDVARHLGAEIPSDVHIGTRATETAIKRLSEAGTLASYRTVHFATHGAIAGEIAGTLEPGLVLTPPDRATETDDGYLSASEIATLRIDADWVILSACNTAASGARDAEALSGLARAFFYAGARSLLVSHWSVNSDATVNLITRAVTELTATPGVGRADALQRSMMHMLREGKPYEAHPAFWAPFVLVGEGSPLHRP
jgi:tetratricopeptide (TPR) repeat protein/CHAT domain-containing protein